MSDEERLMTPEELAMFIADYVWKMLRQHDASSGSNRPEPVGGIELAEVEFRVVTDDPTLRAKMAVMQRPDSVGTYGMTMFGYPLVRRVILVGGARGRDVRRMLYGRNPIVEARLMSPEEVARL